MEVGERVVIGQFEVATEADTAPQGLVKEDDAAMGMSGGGGKQTKDIFRVGVDLVSSEIEEEEDGTRGSVPGQDPIRLIGDTLGGSTFVEDFENQVIAECMLDLRVTDCSIDGTEDFIEVD